MAVDRKYNVGATLYGGRKRHVDEDRCRCKLYSSRINMKYGTLERHTVVTLLYGHPWEMESIALL